MRGTRVLVPDDDLPLSFLMSLFLSHSHILRRCPGQLIIDVEN